MESFYNYFIFFCYINKIKHAKESQDDLYKFPNLEILSLCNMTIRENDMVILCSLPKLKTIKLYNCDFSDDNLLIIFQSKNCL